MEKEARRRFRTGRLVRLAQEVDCRGRLEGLGSLISSEGDLRDRVGRLRDGGAGSHFLLMVVRLVAMTSGVKESEAKGMCLRLARLR